MQKIAVALLDPHLLFRSGVAHIIEDFEKYTIIYEAGSGTELFHYLSIGNLPQIVLTAILLPDQSGYEVTRRLKQQYPSIKVIALSAIYSEYAVWRMVDCGACGFITKATEPQHLQQVLNRAIAPDFECGGLGGLFVQHMLPPEVKKADINNTYHLTETEVQFLQFCCTQMSYQQMAPKLNMSSKAVEKLRDKLCEQLKVRTRQELAVFTVVNGFKMDMVPIAR